MDFLSQNLIILSDKLLFGLISFYLPGVFVLFSVPTRERLFNPICDHIYFSIKLSSKYKNFLPDVPLFKHGSYS